MREATNPAQPLPKESVWDYPRPPRLEPCSSRVRVLFAGILIADSSRSFRLLETSHPPAYYIPPGDVRTEWIRKAANTSFCEYKGEAEYWDLQVNTQLSRAAAWSYPTPAKPYGDLRNHFCFYASRVQECLVGDARVIPQAGDFYGGWITPNLVGPFKGGPGTSGW